MSKVKSKKLKVLILGMLMPIFLFNLAPYKSYANNDEPFFQIVAIKTNDPFFTSNKNLIEDQWYLPKIRVPDSWGFSKGSSDVIVAIVDTGIHAGHVELNDGRVIEGYNSITKQVISAGSNSDDNGHGTSVAGVIGAISNNKKGIAGINWNVQLMPIKALDADGLGSSNAVASGIIWATDHNANIINLSIGGIGFKASASMAEAISYAYNHGVLIVAAVGNDLSEQGLNLDVKPIYPVCGDNAQNMVLGVAATDINDQKASFSNFGHSCVDVSAPGKHILTTGFFPKDPSNNLLIYGSGTSLAAPIVSGVAALLKAENPNLSNVEIRKALINSADNIDAINQTSCSGGSCNGFLGAGRINALAAVTPHPLEEGNLVRQVSTGNIYIIQNNKKRLISNFVFKQRGFDPVSVISETNGNLSDFSTGFPIPPLDGTLIKSSDSALVYVIIDDVKRPLTYPVFISRGYKFSDILELGPTEVDGFAGGDWFYPPEGTMIVVSGNPLVYVMQDRVARAVTNFVFVQRHLSFARLTNVSSDEFSHMPKPKDKYWLSPLDGTLIKSDENPGVYVINNGQKQLLSQKAFVAGKYLYANVIILPQAEVDVIVPGKPIIN